MDQGRPVTVRFSGGEEEDLAEELEIDVGSTGFCVLGAPLLVDFGASMFGWDVWNGNADGGTGGGWSD